jgi:hypothetical protein
MLGIKSTIAFVVFHKFECISVFTQFFDGNLLFYFKKSTCEIRWLDFYLRYRIMQSQD